MECETFIPPPEAPVYEPTEEEFKDPITYIASIRPEAEKYGICRIKPPSHWQPPFAADPDTYKFTPRIQKLNELEAKSRIKLHFLDHLTRFWQLQHNPLKIPYLENKHLDLYHLRKFVHERDGYHKVTHDFKWRDVARQLGYSPTPEIANALKNYYLKLLLPYDVFVVGTPDINQQINDKKEDKNTSQKKEFHMKKETEGPLKIEFIENNTSQHNNFNYKYSNNVGIGINSNTTSTNNTTTAKNNKNIENNNYINNNTMKFEDFPAKKTCHELRKLQFYGAGPKIALPDAHPVEEFYDDLTSTSSNSSAPWKRTRPKTKDGKVHSDGQPGNHCISCGEPCTSNSITDSFITCSLCTGLFHHACLILPVRESSRRLWRCPYCIAKECKRPMPSFGFEQSQCEYSLRSYGLMADKFKSDYFKMPCHSVPCSMVEQEFWRLVNCLEEDVVVEYGADIHTLEFGSGFPTLKNQHLIDEEDKIYISSPWNLNNLPNLEHSLLKYINVDINGMKVPWIYVGMCFSSFAWHIEDHWSYSVNYMHWGEPKTWYGVPGSSASHLEECMSKNAPELFAQFPDLLHQLTTIMNPNVLQQSGVPIYRTDQHAGEFVVTFSRSYHSGFNQGYNCAEAVNFCTADWLPFGHGCIENYRLHKRQCVFSNDEFVFNILAHVHELTQECMYALYQILMDIVKNERETREYLKKENITVSQQESFELLSDDDRQCEYCKTTCFLSAVTCNCSPRKMACLHHISELCPQCPRTSVKFLYKYTIKELNEKIDNLQTQLHGFKNWIIKAKVAMEAKGRDRLSLSSMQCILKEAHDNNYPSCPTLEMLRRDCEYGERCQAVALKLLGPDGNVVSKCKVKRRRSRRNKNIGSDDEDEDAGGGASAGVHDNKSDEKVSYNEFMGIINKMDTLSFKLMCSPKLKELSTKIEKFRKKLRTDMQKYPLDSEMIDKFFDQCYEYPIEIPEVAMLHHSLSQISWLDEIANIQQETIKLSCDTVLRLHETGLKFTTPDPRIASSLEFLKELIATFKKLEFTAASYLLNKPWRSLEDVEKLVTECQESKVVIPSVGLLSSALKDAKEWCSSAEEMFPKLFQEKNPPPAPPVIVRKKGPFKSTTTTKPTNTTTTTTTTTIRPKMEDLNNLVIRGQQIPILLPMLDNIINLKSQATTWIAQLSQMLLKSSQQSLLDVLLPRKDIPSLINKSTRSLKSNTNSNNCKSYDNDDTTGGDDVHCMIYTTHLDVQELDRLCESEITNMKSLKQANEKKLNVSPNASIMHCLCGLGKYGNMVQCCLCDELYHYSCVEYNNNNNNTVQPLSFPLLSPFDVLKKFEDFLCPQCTRSNRQRTPDLNNFVNRYNNDLEVDLQEGLALCHMMKRVEEWKTKVKAIVKGKSDLKVVENLWRILVEGKITPNLEKKFHLTKNTRTELENLLLEGDLMEVHMSERYLLRYTLSCHDALHYKTRLYEFPNVLPDVIKMLPKKQYTIRKKQKRWSRDGQNNQTKGNRNVINSNNSIDVPHMMNVDNNVEDVEDEICSAHSCIRPKDEEVEWIQCDICQRWFHFICLGLKRCDVTDDVEFICTSCTQQPCDIVIKGCYSLASAAGSGDGSGDGGQKVKNEESPTKKRRKRKSSTIRAIIEQHSNPLPSPSTLPSQSSSTLVSSSSSSLLSPQHYSSLSPPPSSSLSSPPSSSLSSPPSLSSSSLVLSPMDIKKKIRKIILVRNPSNNNIFINSNNNDNNNVNNNNINNNVTIDSLYVNNNNLINANNSNIINTNENNRKMDYHNYDRALISDRCITIQPTHKIESLDGPSMEPVTIINLDSDDDAIDSNNNVNYNNDDNNDDDNVINVDNDIINGIIVCDDDEYGSADNDVSAVGKVNVDEDIKSDETKSICDNDMSICEDSLLDIDDNDNNGDGNINNDYNHTITEGNYNDKIIIRNDDEEDDNNDDNGGNVIINNVDDNYNNDNNKPSLFCEVIVLDD